MSISSSSKRAARYSLVRLNLSARLKRRIAAVVRGTGKTPHDFMVEAITLKVQFAGKRNRSSG